MASNGTSEEQGISAFEAAQEAESREARSRPGGAFAGNAAAVKRQVRAVKDRIDRTALRTVRAGTPMTPES